MKKSNRKFQVSHYTIHSKKLPAAFDGYRIVHLSDLHGAVFGRKNENLIRAVQGIHPDLVAMTGDMADNTRDAALRALRLCGKLTKDFPVYYSIGNHEQTLRTDMTPPDFLRELRGQGVHVLDNSRETVSRRGSLIRLYGLTTGMVYYKDPLGEYRKGAYFSAEDTKELLGTAGKDCFNLLLAHNPLYFPSYRDWGADLTLSGHIHGGILRIPYLGGVLSPDLTLFPKYDAGYFAERGKQMIVSRGLGNHFLFRVCNPPEVVVITLQTTNQSADV
ncbi:MAG: metallophosphoesterase [Clostridiales bacterium]|nr:metallophosphoesterase [Clostridiales bacterium]